MNKTIKVDLSCFFDDERKMSYIFVDPNWKTVECMQKRLELLFDISSVWLLSDGCFLPSKEPIEIIRCCNVIKAFVPKDSLVIRKNKKSKQPKEALEVSKNKEYLKIDQQKNVKDEFVSSTHVTTESPISKSNNILDEGYNEEKHFSFKNSNKPSKKRKLINDEEIKTTCSFKTVSSTPLNETNLLEESNNTQDLSKSKNVNNPFKKHKFNKPHIYFDESGDILNSKSKKEKKIKEPETIVVFSCPLNDENKSKARIFHLISKNVNTKQKIDIQEDILISSHSMQAATNISTLSNNEKTINNVCKETEEGLATNNSTIAPRNKKDQASLEKLNYFQNGETNINEAVIKDVDETLNKTNDEITTSADVAVSEMKNESQMETGISIDADLSDVQNHVKPQMELTVEKEQAPGIEDKSDINQSFNNEPIINYVDLSVDLEEELHSKHDSQKNNNLTQDDETTDVEEVSEIIDLNETENNCSTTSNDPKERTMYAIQKQKKIRTHKILPFSADTKDLPNINDILVFKVSYINSSKTRVVTNFVAGKVEYVNKRSKNIKVLILDGISELCHVPNHFFCSVKDSNESNKYLQLKFSELVEPKLFSMD